MATETREENKQMTTYREFLADQLIHLYGFENPIVIAFCEMCERLEDNYWNNHSLTILTEAHLADPALDD